MLLTIEKLVYGGDGLARGLESAIFVPFVLEGEQIEADVALQRPGFARAELTNVLLPSSERIEPRCPYFTRCGGCHYQHTNYEHQLAIKQSVLRETLRRIGKIEWTGDIPIHTSTPWQYRNRTRMRIMRQPQFSLAYFRFGSHDPLAIAECPISSPLINRTITAINRLGLEGGVPKEISEVEFFADSSDSKLVLELFCVRGTKPKSLQEFAGVARGRLPEVVSIATFESSDSDHGHGQKLRATRLHGPPSLSYDCGGFAYQVSAGSFFQVNRHMTGKLMALATDDHQGELALDLYAGVGLFTLPLSRNYQRVIAVEAAPSSAGDLRHNAPMNVEALEQPVDRFLASAAARLRPDFVLVDPPRAGLGERVTTTLVALAAPRVAYVSCDPATLARDLRILLAGGYAIEQMHLVDLFPQTFHLETVTHLARLR